MYYDAMDELLNKKYISKSKDHMLSLLKRLEQEKPEYTLASYNFAENDVCINRFVRELPEDFLERNIDLISEELLHKMAVSENIMQLVIESGNVKNFNQVDMKKLSCTFVDKHAYLNWDMHRYTTHKGVSSWFYIKYPNRCLVSLDFNIISDYKEYLPLFIYNHSSILNCMPLEFFKKYPNYLNQCDIKYIDIDFEQDEDFIITELFGIPNLITHPNITYEFIEKYKSAIISTYGVTEYYQICDVSNLNLNEISHAFYRNIALNQACTEEIMYEMDKLTPDFDRIYLRMYNCPWITKDFLLRDIKTNPDAWRDYAARITIKTKCIDVEFVKNNMHLFSMYDLKTYKSSMSQRKYMRLTKQFKKELCERACAPHMPEGRRCKAEIEETLADL